LTTFRIILAYTDDQALVVEIVNSLPKYRVTEVNTRFEAFQENLAKDGLITARSENEKRTSNIDRMSRQQSAKSGARSKRGGKSNEKYNSKASEAESGRPSIEQPNLSNMIDGNLLLQTKKAQ